MNVAGWCIRNNRTASVIFLLIALAGIHTFMTMSRLEDPEFTIRIAVISTSFPGASPQKVEELITDKIEKKVQEMAEVKTISSQSMTGLSIVFVELYPRYFDLQPIWEKLRNKIDDVKQDLPEGVYGPVVDDEFGDVFPVVIALTGDGYTFRELKDTADDIRDKLLKIDNVAKVELCGTQEERIFIEFSNARLAELGLSPGQLAQVLQAQNVLQPGGDALVGPERITIEATGEFKTLDQIKRVSLRVPGKSESVYLEDITTISRNFVDPPTTMTRFNGKPCIMISVSMASGGKVTDMGKAVEDKLKQLNTNLPIGLDAHLFLYQPKYVDRSIREFTSNLGQAFFFVVIVMLIFCGLRMGLIAGTLIPMAMLMCIGLMPVFDITLQSVSIASLIIALGMLVDNGIVTSENILVRLASGEERFKACAAAVKELWMPLLTASLTTICAFLPIAIAKSDVAEYCISLFQVVSLTLLCSWVLSITLIPLLCYYFLKPKARKQTFEGRLYDLYRKGLIFSLKRPFLFIVVLLALLFSALWSFRFLPSIFFPPNEREMLLVDFWQPYGTDIRTTHDRSAELETFIMADPDVVSVGSFVGEGGPRWYLALNVEQANPNYANIIINTKNKECVTGLMQRIRDHLAEHYPDCRFSAKKLETGPPVGAPIQIRLSGRNIDTVYRLRDQIENVISDVPGVENIRDNWGEWTKKLVVDVNQEQAKAAGFTSEDVATSLMSQMSGMEVTQFREGKKIIPIVLRSKEAFRQDLGKIEELNVYSYSTSGSIPLRQIAKASLVWQPSNILRRDTTRSMTIQADAQGRFASEILADIIPKIEALKQSGDWPDGYKVEYAGENAESAEAQESIMAGVPFAMALLALVLISQFNSIRRPLIIALTIPPMFIGIVYGLLITRCPFGFMAFLGMISLMGIIVNNAIMIIDRIEIERSSGQTLQDAIVVAAQKRFRPILMTAITTIVGLMPLSIQGGPMWEPMANTIIFGLAFATVLTLALCPVLYSLFFRTSFKAYAWNPEVLTKSRD